VQSWLRGGGLGEQPEPFRSRGDRETPSARRGVSDRRVRGAILLVLALWCGCYRYTPVPLAQLEGDQVPVGTALSITFRDQKRKPVLLLLEQIDFPFVVGHVHVPIAPGESRKVRRRIDLRDAATIEVRELDGTRTLVLAVGIPVVVFAGLLVLVAVTKESCPLLYVDRGHGLELVGEAYAGAAFRALEREDLLPIPELSSGGRVHLQLANKAHETQYTDLARLVVTDHSPEVRVLSSPAAQLVAVGAARLPESVVGQDGRRFEAALSAADGTLWESDLEALAARSEAPRSDGVVARFEAPPGSGELVLELVAGNTYLLDVTFGRFFAAMGDRLDEYLARGNDPEARERLLDWRLREGVDLNVESLEDGVWRRVGIVPTVGPMALREIALPLPDRAPGRPIELRLTAGAGFWRLDRLALSRRVNEPLSVREVPLARATLPDGVDQRALLGEVDGRHQVLARREDQVDLEFEMPDVVPGRARSAFFRSFGFYNVHRPFQDDYTPGNLLVAARETGGLARFALDLYREYQELARAPRSGARAGAGMGVEP
jgi:hypothetical protein